MHWAKNSQFSYFKYRIYSINRFLDLSVGAYSRWALTKFSLFLASSIFILQQNNK